MSQALKEARQRAIDELNKLAEVGETRKWSDEERERVSELRAEIADLDERISLLDEMRDRKPAEEAPAAAEAKPEIRDVAKQAAPSVEVTQRSAYQDPKQSWFRDVATLRDRTVSNADVKEARERLMGHYEAEGQEGSYREVRALSAGTDAEGGYLVAPAHLQDKFIEYRTAGVPVTQLVSKMPLPPKTDQINMPKQDGATAVAVHTENNDAQETSATFATVQASVLRYAGAQTMPNFLLQRSLPGVDEIVMRDLARQLAVKVNTDIIGGTTPEGILNADGIGTATATAGTATFGDLWPALVNAIYDVTAAHYVGRPEAIVMHPRRWAWLLGRLDADTRPYVGSINPWNSPAALQNVGQGRTEAAALVAGEILGVPVYLDANIPTTLGSGTDEDRIIVGVFSEAYLFEAAPQFAVSTEAQFKKDQTIARVTQDIAFTAERYPGAFSVISGTALNDSP
jgi:HK97 family phage major capsid protein